VNAIHKVVFDTNVLFSAVGWSGKPYQGIQAARQGFPCGQAQGRTG